MSTGLVSFQPIDDVFEDTARAVFEAIRPRILLIGRMDEHFENIAALYQWSEHRASVPNQLGSNIALIVTNSKGILGRVLSRAHPHTAVLAYDDEHVIPVDKRSAPSLAIVAYLKSVSPRFIRGHVRTLLQLQKHFITHTEDVPVIVSQSGARRTIDRIFQSLDHIGHADISCDHIDTFFACFTAFADLTSYAAPVLVGSPKEFGTLVKRKTKTVVLHCRKKRDRAAYEKLKLNRLSVVFVHDYAGSEVSDLDLTGIGHQIEDFYLMAYFLSLQINLSDPLHQTRFIQAGDIDRVCRDYPQLTAFCARIRELHAEGELKFRNIPPKITNVDFAAQPLSELVARLDKAIYLELFSKCDNVWHTAELVSGTAQTTLFDKKKQYQP